MVNNRPRRSPTDIAPPCQRSAILILPGHAVQGQVDLCKTAADAAGRAVNIAKLAELVRKPRSVRRCSTNAVIFRRLTHYAKQSV
jgi:hypothetical protein